MADRDPADYGPADDQGAEPDETTCRTCGHLAIDHTKGRYSIYGVCPPAATPGRDELREQIAAAARLLMQRESGIPADELVTFGIKAADAVMEPVDTWVAAHTAEVAAVSRRTLPDTSPQVTASEPGKGDVVWSLDDETDRATGAPLTGAQQAARYRSYVPHLRRALTRDRSELDALRAAVARVRALCDEAERLHKNTPAANVRIAAALINDIRAALPPTEQT